MLTAIIYYNGEYEGEAILISCMEKKENRSFWEIRFINNLNNTCCRWVNNSDIVADDI